MESLLGHKNPRCDAREDTDPAPEDREHEQESDQYGIDIKVVAETGADARQLSLRLVSVKPLHRASSIRSVMTIPISVSGIRKSNSSFFFILVLSY